jgi:hypothetical protein
MSDRRERVARAIYAVVNDEEHWASEAAWLRADYRSKADAAIAAIDAEPTEAEIAVAKDAYFRASVASGRNPTVAMRAALIAARTARQGGQG